MLGSGAASAQATAPAARVGVAVRTLVPFPVGVDVAVALSRKVNLRAGFNMFTLNHDFDNDGINIAAARGTPVVAADGGTVVYAGNELRGYGNLLLVRHAGGWITAYAHLDRILVNKGAAQHNFYVDDLGIKSDTLNGGDSGEVKFTASAVMAVHAISGLIPAIWSHITRDFIVGRRYMVIAPSFGLSVNRNPRAVSTALIFCSKSSPDP